MTLKVYYEGLTRCNMSESHLFRVVEPEKNVIKTFSVSNFKNGVATVEVPTEFVIRPTLITFIACFDKSSNFQEKLKEIFPKEESLKEICFVFNNTKMSVKSHSTLKNLMRTYFFRRFSRKKK